MGGDRKSKSGREDGGRGQRNQGSSGARIPETLVKIGGVGIAVAWLVELGVDSHGELEQNPVLASPLLHV